MPIYQCYAPQGLLTKAAKTQIAEEIASIHCNATGAPRSFVNVLYRGLPGAPGGFGAGATDADGPLTGQRLRERCR